MDAAGVVAALRNIGPEELIVDSVEMGFQCVAVATVFTGVAFAFHKVVGFTALPIAGARAPAPRPIRKRLGDHFELLPAADPAAVRNPATTFAEVSIAGTVTLGNATYTAPNYDDPVGQLICNIGTGGGVGGLAKHEPRNGVPWTLAPNEGLIFVSQLATPAGLTGRFTIGIEARLA